MEQGSPDRPLVFAHRGSSATYAEHTLDAYLQAIEDGADGLECDVRLTRDGHLVCLHDSRLDRTSDGRGRVSVHTLAELTRLDFGSWHPALPANADDFINDRPAPGVLMRSQVLTLDRLLSVAVDAGRPIQLLVETKHPSRYGSAVEAAVVSVLRRYGLDRSNHDATVRVSVMSFSPMAVRRIRSLAPEVPAVMLMEVVPPGLRSGRLPFHSRIGGPGIRLLRAHPELVERFHRQGHRVYVWTVNEPDDLDLVLRLGVDGIISDRPGEVIDQLRVLGRRT